MNPILLVAWREYKQYVFSRGFLLFLIMLPLIMVAGAFVLSVVENVRPQRAFVVYDASGGEYATLIEDELSKQHLREAVAAWDGYLAVSIDREKIAPKDIAFPFGAGEITHARLDAFETAGGFDAALGVISDVLRPGAPAFAVPRPRFLRLPAPIDVAAAGSTADAAALLRPYLLRERALPGAPKGELFAAVLIPEGFAAPRANEATDAGQDAEENEPQAEFWSENVTDPTLEMAVARALRSVLRKREAASLGLSDADLERISDIDAPMAVFTPGDDLADAELDNAERLERIVLPGVMTYVLLVVVFAVGNPLLTNTIEERSNKIVEVLLSSVTANQLMIGKLVGIAAVGLTMPAIVLVGTGLAALAGFAGGTGGDAAAEALAALFRSNLLPIFVFYFLAAYLIFAMMFLAIGALSNSIQDAQTFMGPLMLVVFAPMPFIVMVFQNPNGLIASILTWIPIYTPYAVMLRAASDPPLGEIIGATCLMLAFAAVLARVMGRIFKNAILNASPPKAREIWRLARADA
ncbi:MAG: ABC transporter permease [Pseudomonadota bacterium]